MASSIEAGTGERECVICRGTLIGCGGPDDLWDLASPFLSSPQGPGLHAYHLRVAWTWLLIRFLFLDSVKSSPFLDQ